MRTRVLAAVVVLAGVTAGAARAQDPPPPAKPLERAELDKRIAINAFMTSSAGYDMYSKKNYEGCYRFFQGSLSVLYSLLDHRPKLQQAVKDRLDKSRDLNPVEGALLLRETLDMIQKETAEAMAPPKKDKEMPPPVKP